MNLYRVKHGMTERKMYKMFNDGWRIEFQKNLDEDYEDLYNRLLKTNKNVKIYWCDELFKGVGYFFAMVK